MTQEQEIAFWDCISVFDSEGLLSLTMLIGSWAEYMYQYQYDWGYDIELQTRDADFLYPNLNRPGRKIPIIEKLRAKGFIYNEDRMTGIGKFMKEDLLEIEFLVRILGEGSRMYETIPSIGIKAVGFRDMNVLSSHPMFVERNGYVITVPEPEAYIVQKLLANPDRSEGKQEKDIQAIRELLKYIDKDKLHNIIDKLVKKQQEKIKKVCKDNFIKI